MHPVWSTPSRWQGQPIAAAPLGLVGCLLLALAGCAGTEARTTSAGPEVSRGDFEQTLLLTGELEAVRSITIKAPQTSLFQMRIQFMAEEGSVIRQGEPLLGFDNSSLAAQVRDLEGRILDAEIQIVAKQNELKSALKDLEIALAETQYEFERAELDASVDPGIVSRKVYGDRQLAFDKAVRELEETNRRIALTRERGQADVDVLVINRNKLRRELLSAQNDLELLTIEAPSDGLVVYMKRPRSTVRFQEGDSCWPGQGVIKLPDLQQMQVAFNVHEVDAPRLELGTEVAITLDAFPGRQLAGAIRHIPSMAVTRDESSKIRVFKVIANLNETWVGEMKPGMSALGSIVVARLSDVPLIAREAVHSDGQSYWLETAAGGRDVLRPLARNASHYVLSESEYARLGGAGPVRVASVGDGS